MSTPSIFAGACSLALQCVMLALASAGNSEYFELLQKGDKLAASQDEAGAQKAYEAAVTAEPAKFQAYFAWGTSECQRNNLEKCKKLFKDGLKRCPDNYRVPMQKNSYIELGKAYYRTKEYDKAVRQLKAALKGNPLNTVAPVAWYTIGQALEAKAKIFGGGWQDNKFAKESLKAYESSASSKAFPGSDTDLQADCYTNLGMMHMNMDSLDNAEDYLKQALELKPEHSRARTQLINVHLYRGNVPDADKIAAKGVSLKLWERMDQTPAQFTRGLKSTPWPDVSQYDDVTAVVEQLEDGHNDIYSEMKKLLLSSGLSSGTMENIAAPSSSPKNGWHAKTIDCVSEKGRDETPQTCRVIDRIHYPMYTAQFLRLEPNSILRAHTGEGNFRWIVHLGLDVPANVSITVAGETRSWQKRKCIVFEDSYRHSVEHRGSHDRIVLALQIQNPEYSATLGRKKKNKKKEEL